MVSSAVSRPPSFSRQPSFTRSEFPLLSPAMPERPRLRERKASWSAVVGGSDRDLMRETTMPVTKGAPAEANPTAAMEDADSFAPVAGIPPLPLCRMPSSEEVYAEDGYIDADEESNSGDDEVTVDPVPFLTTQSSWTNRHKIPQRQRSRSFHHYPPTNLAGGQNIHAFSTPNNSLQPLPSNDVHSPFSSFTTMSIAALQNDIGTVLARSNRVQEAIERYKLSIASATATLEGLRKRDEESVESTSRPRTTGAEPRWKECPKVTEAEGLAWFRQKLLRGGVLSAANLADEEAMPEGRSASESVATPFQPAGFGGRAPPTPRRMRSASFSVEDLRPPSKQQSAPSVFSEIVDGAQGKTLSIDEMTTPDSPVRRSTSAARMASCPVTAPHPGRPSVSMARSNSGRATVRHAHTPLDDIVHDIHQHQKLDCPDEVYSCNGLTPLGLEYVCDPLPVLRGSLRRLVSGTGGPRKVGSMKGIFKSDAFVNGGLHRRGGQTAAMESAALIAARLNLASLEYRIAGGGTSEELQDVLSILELASEDCDAAFKAVEEDSDTGLCKAEFSAVFSLLRAVVHLNIGTVRYRLKKVRESMTSFEAARAALQETNDNERPIHFDHHNEPHDDCRFPPQAYLLLIARLNLSRASLRLDQPDEAQKYCDLISEDNKPHRRNSARLRSNVSLLQQRGSHRGFHRSDSFSAASSSLETSIAAYEHDIDRRSKWLASVSEHYLVGLILEGKGEASDYKEAWHHYNRLLSLARTKLDHRHAHICALLERRGAVLFEQRKLPCSMLSYLACLKILEHQQSAGSSAFDRADLSRILYAIARLLHDKEEYHDALHVYQRALACQRALAAEAGRPSLDVITTLCNISRMHHLSGEIDSSLAANREVLELATILVGGKMEHPFLIHRLKVEGNILVEAGRLEDAMRTFVEAARRCSEDGRDQMMTTMMGGGGGGGGNSSQEDADAGDSSVLSIRSASALAMINFIHPAASAA